MKRRSASASLCRLIYYALGVDRAMPPRKDVVGRPDPDEWLWSALVWSKQADGSLKIGSTGDDNALEALAGASVYSIKNAGMAALCSVTPKENGRRNNSRCLETRVSGAENLSVQPWLPWGRAERAAATR